MNFATVISAILMGLFIYFQRDTLWFNFIFHGIELGYDPNLVADVRSIFVLAILIGFIFRNEVDNLGGHHHRN